MSEPRMACVSIPDFSAEVLIRYEPALKGKLLALTEVGRPDALIVAVNQAAIEAGVTTELTAAQAGVLCPGLLIRRRDLAQESKAEEMIVERLRTLSPSVETTSQAGTFLLDASGLERLHQSEEHLARKIQAVLRPTGYPVRVGIAANMFVAQVAAEVTRDGRSTLIPTGGEEEFLQHLTIDHLRLSPEIAEHLHDLGLSSIGQVAAIQGNELARRFGAAGATMAHHARGEELSLFAPAKLPEELSIALVLTYPVFTASAIIAHTEQLLTELFDKLSQLAQGCSEIVITLSLEDKTAPALTVALERPTLSTRKFMRQLRAILEKTKLPSGVNGLTITIPNLAVLISEQLGLRVSGIDAAASRLPVDVAGMPCHQQLTAARLQCALLPEKRFHLYPLGEIQAKARELPAGMLHPYTASPLNGLRLLAEPRPVEVTIDGDRPCAMRLGESGDTDYPASGAVGAFGRLVEHVVRAEVL